MKKLFLCEDCYYFIQHYGLNSNGTFKVYCGHCVKRVLKFSTMCKLKICPNYKHSEKLEQNLLKEMLLKLEKNLVQISDFIDSKKD